jgi:glycosyltransferase involved in cell wall biosynthesis
MAESMTSVPEILVFSPHPSAWRWYESDMAGRARFIFHNEEPKSALERKITKPRLSRILGAWRCARQATLDGAAAIAAHSQFSTFWVALALRALRSNVPLLSFSFHYAILPLGIRLTFAKWAFSRVARFVVHSEPERARYAHHFGLPLDLFDLVRWGVEPASVETGEAPPVVPGPYICAVGKDGRDYRTLIEAMQGLPDLNLIVVAQPHNLKSVAIPDNVKVLINIPLPDAMNIIQYCQFMALPLETGETSCGHITIVSAMFCGKAIVATRSVGISDYFPENYPAPTVAAGDVEGWRNALSAVARAASLQQRCGELGRSFALHYCSHEAALRNSLEVFRRAGVEVSR